MSEDKKAFDTEKEENKAKADQNKNESKSLKEAELEKVAGGRRPDFSR